MTRIHTLFWRVQNLTWFCDVKGLLQQPISHEETNETKHYSPLLAAHTVILPDSTFKKWGSL